MTRKLVAICALLTGLFALVGPAAPASAGGPTDYSDCIVTVSDTTPEPGQEIQVSGTGFQNNFETDIIFDLGKDSEEVLATVTTDDTGEFGPVTVTVPADATEGDHTITTSCDSDSVNATTVTVLGAALTPGAPLPKTGSDIEPLVLAGGAAILAGAAFVLVAQRRRKAANSS